jgi:hypothetical protein
MSWAFYRIIEVRLGFLNKIGVESGSKVHEY